jgi:hypothetical protein
MSLSHDHNTNMLVNTAPSAKSCVDINLTPWVNLAIHQQQTHDIVTVVYEGLLPMASITL